MRGAIWSRFKLALVSSFFVLSSKHSCWCQTCVAYPTHCAAETGECNVLLRDPRCHPQVLLCVFFVGLPHANFHLKYTFSSTVDPYTAAISFDWFCLFRLHCKIRRCRIFNIALHTWQFYHNTVNNIRTDPQDDIGFHKKLLGPTWMRLQDVYKALALSSDSHGI